MIRFDRAVFVVTESKKSEKPLYLSFRFADAKAFVLGYNRLTASGRSVIRPGKARVKYDGAKVCKSEFTS